MNNSMTHNNDLEPNFYLHKKCFYTNHSIQTANPLPKTLPHKKQTKHLTLNIDNLQNLRFRFWNIIILQLINYLFFCFWFYYKRLGTDDLDANRHVPFSSQAKKQNILKFNELI